MSETGNEAAITVISDPGVDDVIALVLLDRLRPGTPKVLVSTFGNNLAGITSVNASRVVAYLGQRWLYRPGAAVPLSGSIDRPLADDYHGPDGVWGAQPSTESIASATSDQPTSTVLSLAPLTEGYRMLGSGKAIGMTIMAGAFADGVKSPEFNAAMDARAARLFFEECNQFVPRVVPKDVTQLVRWSRQDVLAVPPTSPTNIWLRQMLLAWFEHYGTPLGRDFPLHDPLAVLLALHPDHAEWTRSAVTVVEGGRDHGRTRLAKDGPPCDVAHALSEPNLVARQIHGLVFDH